ncbi:hypothetical protein JCM10212_002708 [Sporobolomyces blumeae]
MQERRVFQPPLASSKAKGSRLPSAATKSSSRLPKPAYSSSTRPSISRPISQPSLLPPPRASAALRPTSNREFLPSTALPYLDHAARTSSLAASGLATTATTTLTSRPPDVPSHPSTRLANRRVSNNPSSAHPSLRPALSALASEPRPHSFPPQQRHRQTGESAFQPAAGPSGSRVPPRVSRDPANASDDPFKVHANRVLRSSASTVFAPDRTAALCSSLDSTADLSDSSFSVVHPPSRSSSLTKSTLDCLEGNSITSASVDTPAHASYHALATSTSSPHASLRRTATVRSATRQSVSSSLPSSSRIVRGRSRNGATGRRKPSISGTESFLLMARQASNQSSAVSTYSQDGTSEASPAIPNEQDLVRQWKAFVETSGGEALSGPSRGSRTPNGSMRMTKTPSLLVDQTLPTSLPEYSTPSLRSPRSRTFARSKADRPASPACPAIFSPDAFQVAPASDDAKDSESRPSSILSISSSHRDLSTTLPRTRAYLHARPASFGSPFDVPTVYGLDDASQGMTRVDSEVLLTRLTLKRLGSRGFEGDALDKLGRGGGGGGGGEQGGEWEDLREIDEEQDLDDWADRYRDSYDGWEVPESPKQRGRSSVSRQHADAPRDDSTREPEAWQWRPSNTSTSTGSLSSSSSISSASSGGFPKSTSSSTVSSSTSIGTLSRNWSKSTLMEELEREVGRISRDFDAEFASAAMPSKGSGEWDQGVARGSDGVDSEDGYVCALDLIFEDSESSSSEADSSSRAPSPCSSRGGSSRPKPREVPVRRGGLPLPVPLAASAKPSMIPLPRAKPSIAALRAAPASSIPVPSRRLESGSKAAHAGSGPGVKRFVPRGGTGKARAR